MLTVREEDLSEDQQPVYGAILDWIEKRRVVPGQRDSGVLTLGGLAGTGKSSLVSVLAERLGAKRVCFCALTGKATGVLRRKLAAVGLTEADCRTVHSLIYTADENPITGVVAWKRKDRSKVDYDLIIVDEASMVSEDVLRDLKSFEIPILAVGDHGQLPPVQGGLNGFNLMADPLLKLEKIHRQAEGNPIIRLSMHVRQTGQIDPGAVDGVHVRVVDRTSYTAELSRFFDPEVAPPAQLFEQAVIVYTNQVRCWLNDMVGQARYGKEADDRRPVVGEQLICLKNANVFGKDGPRLFNGMRAVLETQPVEHRDGVYTAKVRFPEETFVGTTDTGGPSGNEFLLPLSKHQFGREKTFSSLQDFSAFGFTPRDWTDAGRLFDYGYALTGHRCQGSQWSDVLLFLERPGGVNDEQFRRWIYTAATRASDRLVIVKF